MSNFMKGFNQGFTPYVGNISDLISNTLMSRAKEQRETDRKAEEERIKLEKEKAQELLYNKYYEEGLKGDFTNYRFLPSEKRVALNQELEKNEPKVFHARREIAGKGDVWYEIKTPKDGSAPTVTEMLVTPTQLRTETKTVGNKKIETTYYTDGTSIPTDITELEKKGEKLPKGRRELFHHPDSDTRKFEDDYRQRIRLYNQAKKNVESLKPNNPSLEKYTPTYTKAKNKLEEDEIKLYNSQLELVSDDGLAKNLNKMYDEDSIDGWNNFYNSIYDQYKEGGFDDSELKNMWVLDTLYEIKFGKKSPLHR